MYSKASNRRSLMNVCKICGKETKNKVYCGVICQYEGYRVIKVKRITKICEYCDDEFEVKRTSKHPHRFCSRKCTDLWKKENALKGEDNPNYGRKHTVEWKKSASDRAKRLWESQKHREKVAKGQHKFLVEHGYWWGWSEASKVKRKETMLKKHGIEHNWNGKFGKGECDKTCIEKYSKSNVKLRQNGITKEIWHKRRRAVIENRYKISF